MRISFSGGSKAKLKHNTREFISKNVDESRTSDNIIIKDMTVHEAYEELFGEAQRKYNAKQKRKERKIDNYYSHLFGDVPESRQDEIQTNQNRQKSFVECIVQVGDKDSTGFATNPKNAQIAIECLLEYIEGFQERNPYFYVFNAIIHCDETTPHLHFDYIPFADNYTKGMERQLSIAKALELMGYGKNVDNAIRDFTQNERKIFREICERHGLEIEKERKSREIRFTPKQMREGISELYSELTEIENSLNTKKSALQQIETSIQEKQSALSEVTAQVNTATKEVYGLQEQKQTLKREIDADINLINSYTPSPTKKVKSSIFGKEKEIEKTTQELQDEKLILTAQAIINNQQKLLQEATRKAELVISSAQDTAQKIISEAENSEIVISAKSEAEKIIQEAELKKSYADDYYTDLVALAEEEAEEYSRQLDKREAHINTLAELSRPTEDYKERMQWLYDMPIRRDEEELSEEVSETEEEFDFYEDAIEIDEPDYYNYEY
ncbi:MAG: plasmid recombination protein [Ruminococcus sp.]|nr:plasmid recombination protein [Ruminococcus sp.]